VDNIQSILEIISKGWCNIRLHAEVWNGETDLIVVAVEHTICGRNVPRDVVTKTKLLGFGPRANYADRQSDRRLLAKLVPIFEDRGCRVVSTTDSHGR
jgi:hypothetical protein